VAVAVLLSVFITRIPHQEQKSVFLNIHFPIFYQCKVGILYEPFKEKS